MKTVAIIEGFAGGPKHTRNFRRALVRAGFTIVKNPNSADIVVAHSAGIYAIPLSSKARLLMLIGPVYWPGQRLMKRTLRHTRSSGQYHLKKFGFRYYVWKKLLEVYYVFARNRYLWLGIFNNNKLNRLVNLSRHKGRRIIVIRNTKDPYSSPEIKTILKAPNIKFVELPGVHDDYVSNPKPYVDLLLKEL